MAALIGARKEDLPPVRSPARAVAFLEDGPRSLRVISIAASPDLYAKDLKEDRVVATAALSKKLVFNLPIEVIKRLGIRTTRVGKIQKTTTDVVAWAAPEAERERWIRARAPAGMAARERNHVYLLKSVFTEAAVRGPR